MFASLPIQKQYSSRRSTHLFLVKSHESALTKYSATNNQMQLCQSWEREFKCVSQGPRPAIARTYRHGIGLEKLSASTSTALNQKYARDQKRQSQRANLLKVFESNCEIHDAALRLSFRFNKFPYTLRHIHFAMSSH